MRKLFVYGAGGCVFLCVACIAFSLIGSATGLLPDTRATSTAEAQTEVAVANLTATIIALTPTDTPTITPTASNTPIPSNTPRSTTTPPASATSRTPLIAAPSESAQVTVAPATLSDRDRNATASAGEASLARNLMEVEGVINIRLSVLAQQRNSPGTIASLEIDTAPNYDTQETAQALYDQTYTVAVASYGSGNANPFLFNVILWDGSGPAVDWTWDNQSDSWRITELSITPAPTQASVSVNPASGTRYITATNLNVRSGPGVSNAAVGTLALGAAVSITGEQDGWYRIDYNGQTGWISSQYASTTRPSTPSNNTTSSGGSGSTGGTTGSSNPPAAPPPPSSGASCGGASTCGEMTSCEQAYACLNAGNGRLDRDSDGIPCESICGG